MPSDARTHMASLGTSVPPKIVLEDRRAWSLRPGEAILREDLHERFGGSSRTRISPSAATRNVFIVLHPGTEELWPRSAEVLHVPGERVRGPTLSNANRAVLEHRQAGRALRVFWRTGADLVYAGEFELDAGRPFYFVETHGSGGAVDRRIVFRLLPVEKIVHALNRAPERESPPVPRLRLARSLDSLGARGPWPPVLLCSCAASALMTWGWMSSPLRPAVTTWFLLVCPGMALVRLLPSRGILAQLVLAVATSLTLETLVAEATLEAKVWSPSATLGLLIVLIVAALAGDLWARSSTVPAARPRVSLRGLRG
jgi:hypothetical protein